MIEDLGTCDDRSHTVSKVVVAEASLLLREDIEVVFCVRLRTLCGQCE